MLKIAKINQNNLIEEIFLVSEIDSLDADGNVSEDVAIEFSKSFIQNSEIYTYICLNFHDCNISPSVDWEYLPIENCFRRPRPEGINHTLVYDEETAEWREPIPLESNELPPPEGYDYVWDEDLYQSDNTKGWVLIPIDQLT